jgi:hypothetical protein
MAIKKSQVGKLTNEELAKLKKLEDELLDPRLNVKFDPKSGTPYVVFEDFEIRRVLGGDLDHRMLEVLRSRYSDWRIEYNSSHQGTYLQFF